jgi:sec-independent protein translocase protein TatC
MARAIRAIGHEDRLSLVDHLDELRTRLIISAAVLAVAFALCLWQNHELLNIINKPLTAQKHKQAEKGEGTIGQAVTAQRAVLAVAGDTQAALTVLGRSDSGLSPQARTALAPLLTDLKRDVAKIPRSAPEEHPVTLTIGEPLTTTITVSLYGALLLSLPIILYELYGFILPALKPNERRAAAPLLTAVPFLFAVGVLFGYFVVLPAAVRFLVNFNSSEFNVLIQASTFYRFAATTLLAMGLVFQIPVLILGATRLGLVTPAQLRKQRRYAMVACASVAAFLPGDLITLALETVPLYVLYEASILLATFVKPAGAETDQDADGSAGGARNPAGDGAPTPEDQAQPTVQQIIDHVDKGLSD